jgi:hypothetical protein
MAKFKLAKVQKLEDVPEAYRGLYVQKDDGFEIDPAKFAEFEFDDKAELEGALKREREERKAAKEELKKYEGIDPERARAAQERLDKLDEKKLIDKGEFERLLKKRSDEFDTREAEYKRQLEEHGKRLDTYELTNPVREAALKAGVLPEDVEDVLKINSHRFRLNDKRKPVVLDKDGDETSLTLEQFWGEEFKTARPKFYGASGAGGSGAQPGGTGGGGGGAKTVKRADFEKMPATEQSSLARSGVTVVD